MQATRVGAPCRAIANGVWPNAKNSLEGKGARVCAVLRVAARLNRTSRGPGVWPLPRALCLLADLFRASRLVILLLPKFYWSRFNRESARHRQRGALLAPPAESSENAREIRSSWLVSLSVGPWGPWGLADELSTGDR